MRIRWQQIRRVWVTTGCAVGIVFVTWSLLAYRATVDARSAMLADDRVNVSEGETFFTFAPTSAGRTDVGFLLFPGALVDPVAYAPMMHAIASNGYTALLVQMPMRGGFGGAEEGAMFARASAAISNSGVQRWVVGGHSRGGVVASDVARRAPSWLAGLVLIGTSHPRDFSLAHLKIPTTRVFGTRDTVADLDKLEANRHNLPAATRMVRVDGGNHSQFGSYGFQPGDWPATISRQGQQRITLMAILDILKLAAERE
ncbi:alpha/beta hydrolase [soil metagenome]